MKNQNTKPRGWTRAMLALSMIASASTGHAEPMMQMVGDLTQDGSVDVFDVQCGIVTLFWSMEADGSPAPDCGQDMVYPADVNCDQDINVTDVLLTTQFALGVPLSEAIDEDGNNVPNGCEPEALNGYEELDILREFDLDEDESVTGSEWLTYMGVAAFVDDNGDGFVTAEEYLNGAEYVEEPTEEEYVEENNWNEEQGSENEYAYYDGGNEGSYPGMGTGSTGSTGGTGSANMGGGDTGSGGTGSGGMGGGMGGDLGGDDTFCNENYDFFDFPKVWETHASQCETLPTNGPNDCQTSFAEFCDADQDGEVDDDKRGAGAMVYGQVAPGMADPLLGVGSPIPCPCEKDAPIEDNTWECIEFEPTSPAPPAPGESPHGIVPGACDFYLNVANEPGGCSQEEVIFLGGYHQTCVNVTNGFGTAPSGAMCDQITTWRDYVDGLRYCLQENVADQFTTHENCLNLGVTCADTVTAIRDAHDTCNDENDFCDVMQDEDAAWCFGSAIGDAWGGLFVGTLPSGPFAPLGPTQTLKSILECGLSMFTVQDNICAGYRDACIAAGGGGIVVETLCKYSCPYSTEILWDLVDPTPIPFF